MGVLTIRAMLVHIRALDSWKLPGGLTAKGLGKAGPSVGCIFMRRLEPESLPGKPAAHYGLLSMTYGLRFFFCIVACYFGLLGFLGRQKEIPLTLQTSLACSGSSGLLGSGFRRCKMLHIRPQPAAKICQARTMSQAAESLTLTVVAKKNEHDTAAAALFCC